MKDFIYISLLIIITALVLCIYAVFTYKKPKEAPKIEETAVIVEDIKEISQLFITSYYTEFTSYKEKNKKFLIIVSKGTVYSGIDLSELDSTDVVIANYENGEKHCNITLPRTKVLDAIINPSGYEIFVDEGGFNYEDIQGLKYDAISQLRQRAIDGGINTKAENRIITIFSEYMTNIGFTSHSICFE